MIVLKLFLHIVSAILGLFIAAKLVPGVDFFGNYFMLGVIGAILGLANFFIKPVLKAVSLPIRIITLGLSGLIINIGLVWMTADVLFPKDLEISGIIPLAETTIIIWLLSFFLGLHGHRK